MKARSLFLIIALVFPFGFASLNVSCYACFNKIYPIDTDMERDATTLARSLPLSKREELLVNYAHSNPIFDNVGKLVCDVSCDKKAIGSAVFIGENICLTVAHAYFRDVKYFVHFEVNDQWTPLYKVVEFIVHDEFTSYGNNDIAILVLDRNVQELPGVTPCYDYTSEDKEFDDDTELVAFVGYGKTYMLDKWIMVTDHKRKAFGAYLSTCQVSEDPKEIATQCIESIDDVDYKLAKDQQTLIPFETVIRPGMSGGGVFHPNYGLVAIQVGIKPWNTVNFIYLCIIYFFNFTHYLFHTYQVNDDKLLEDLYSFNTPLWPHKEWIEEICLKYKLPDANPIDSKSDS